MHRVREKVGGGGVGGDIGGEMSSFLREKTAFRQEINIRMRGRGKGVEEKGPPMGTNSWSEGVKRAREGGNCIFSGGGRGGGAKTQKCQPKILQGIKGP